MDERCPNCGARLVKYTVIERVPSKKGKEVHRHNVTYRCDKCDIGEVNPDFETDPFKIEERQQLSKEGFLTDIEIKRIRNKLGLTQEELGRKLGVGTKNFARYESLGGHQSRAMDDLLRILDAYPEAIKILEAVNEKKE